MQSNSFLKCFPAAFLAGTLLVVPKTFVKKTVPHNFILAFSCYAFTCTVALLFWPAEVNPRYILPMVLPLCVLGGIGYNFLLQRSDRSRRDQHLHRGRLAGIYVC